MEQRLACSAPNLVDEFVHTHQIAYAFLRFLTPCHAASVAQQSLAAENWKLGAGGRQLLAESCLPSCGRAARLDNSWESTFDSARVKKDLTLCQRPFRVFRIPRKQLAVMREHALADLLGR